MKLNIQKDIMSQMLHFSFRSDLGTLGVDGGNGNLGNRRFWKLEILENA